jgi:hypothetical protein
MGRLIGDRVPRRELGPEKLIATEFGLGGTSIDDKAELRDETNGY